MKNVTKIITRLLVLMFLLCSANCEPSSVIVGTPLIDGPFMNSFNFDDGLYSEGLVFEINSDAISYSVIGYTGNHLAIAIPPVYNGLPVTIIKSLPSHYNNNPNYFVLYLTDNVISIERSICDEYIRNNVSTIFTQHSSVPSGWADWFDHTSFHTIKPTSVILGVQSKETVRIWTDSSEKSLLSAFYKINGEYLILYEYNVLEDIDTAYGVLPGFNIPSQINGSPVKMIALLLSKHYKIDVVVLPSSIVSILDFAFIAINTIKHCEIPSSVETIGTKAFFECRMLQNIGDSLPPNLRYIGANAFYDAPISGVLVPESVIFMGRGAFSGTKITEFNFPSSLTAIPEVLLAGTRITTVPIPNSILRIESQAFTYTSQLKHLKLHNEISFVGGLCFSSSNIRAIYIPKEVETIQDYAFLNCHNLVLFTNAQTKPANWTSDVHSLNVMWGSSPAAFDSYILSI